MILVSRLACEGWMWPEYRDASGEGGVCYPESSMKTNSSPGIRANSSLSRSCMTTLVGENITGVTGGYH